MIAGLRVRDLAVVVTLAAAALAGALAGIAGRGADEAFLVRQDNPGRVTTPAVERLIRTAPDPRPPHRSPAVSSRCTPGSPRGLRNPWRCTVAYRSGSVAHFLMNLRSDGSYVARYLGGTATATGCCLRLPNPG